VAQNLTSIVVETDEEITVDIVAGTNLQAGTPSVLNVIHFTTTDDVHVFKGIYVASRPTNEIEIDGYNAGDFNEPMVWPFL